MEDVTQHVVSQLIENSDYVAKHSNLLIEIVEKNAWREPLSFAVCLRELSDYDSLSLEDFMVSLRRFRHRCLLRLLLGSLLEKISVEETMRVWSEVADAVIMTALGHAHRWASGLHGVPLDSRGQEVVLYPIALGKLGGQELNFSSDIDLFFIYSETGQTSGSVVVTNEEYFSKLIKKFTYILQHPSPDGFVFRVDLRLRPFGTSGALAMSIAATEAYYQEQGRDWERYAMLKARLIGNDAADLIKHCITPFVYRKYVDFGVIESLRSMKKLIERELLLDPTLNDIKRGTGGIREIEFIIQCVQLIRGGRMPQLQVTGSMRALDMLSAAATLKWSSVLRQAYLFYRTVENALQTFADRQTHTLPENERARAYVLLMSGYDSYAALEKKKRQYQRIVRRLFCRMLRPKNAHVANENDWIEPLLMQVWKGHIETTMAVNALKNQGILHAEVCYHLIHTFRHSPKCRRLSQVARLRLDHLMSRFLISLSKFKPTLPVLESMFHLFDVIVNRSVYLALLTENNQALPRVMFWFQKSTLIANWVVANPFLLDHLIFRNELWRPLTFLQLKSALDNFLMHSGDTEAQEELLREFKLIYWLYIACAELSGQCTAVEASRFLSDLAEVILLAVVKLASVALIQKYPEMEGIQSRFFVLAYGKLGSKEMTYHSDLDLVFLHNAASTEEHFIFRLTQKVLYMLTTRLRAGVLYPTDTRLRPSGASGLLVSRVSAFIEYQRINAWTWEHQALLKARVLLGNRDLSCEFLNLKKDIFTRVLKKHDIFREICAMRFKIQQHHVYEEIKYRSGGLLDLEFFIQYKILGSPNTVWSRVMHTERQLLHLKALGILRRDQCAVLQQAYRAFHDALHQEALLGRPSTVEARHYLAVEELYVFEDENTAPKS